MEIPTMEGFISSLLTTRSCALPKAVKRFVSSSAMSMLVVVERDVMWVRPAAIESKFFTR